MGEIPLWAPGSSCLGGDRSLGDLTYGINRLAGMRESPFSLIKLLEKSGEKERPQFPGQGRRFDALVDFQFAINHADMGFYRVSGDTKLLRDFLIGIAPPNQLQDVNLPSAQA